MPARVPRSTTQGVTKMASHLVTHSVQQGSTSVDCEIQWSVCWICICVRITLKSQSDHLLDSYCACNQQKCWLLSVELLGYYFTSVDSNCFFPCYSTAHLNRTSILKLMRRKILIISVLFWFYSSYEKHAPLDDIFSFSKIKFSWTSIKCFHDEFNCRQENRGIVMETSG